MKELENALERGIALKLLLLSDDAYRRAAERHTASERARVGDVQQALALVDVLFGFCALPNCRGKLEVRISDDVPYFTAVVSDVPIECFGTQGTPIPATAALRVQPRVDGVEQIHGPVLALDPTRDAAQLYLRGISAVWCRATPYGPRSQCLCAC